MMETLHLNLIKKWFDMVLSGEKKEEYRELSDYWKKRLTKVKMQNVKSITFSNGYAKDRRQMIVDLKYISIRQGLEDWGAIPGKEYFVLHLGSVKTGAATLLIYILLYSWTMFLVTNYDLLHSCRRSLFFIGCLSLHIGIK
jgi:hypothetical protein